MAAIAAVYEYHSAGGALHIVIDDFNLEDEHVDACEQFAREWANDPKTNPVQTAAELACIAALRALSVEERASALARYGGIVGEERQ